MFIYEQRCLAEVLRILFCILTKQSVGESLNWTFLERHIIVVSRRPTNHGPDMQQRPSNKGDPCSPLNSWTSFSEFSFKWLNLHVLHISFRPIIIFQACPLILQIRRVREFPYLYGCMYGELWLVLDLKKKKLLINTLFTFYISSVFVVLTSPSRRKRVKSAHKSVCWYVTGSMMHL